jgi:hypothetical protein
VQAARAAAERLASRRGTTRWLDGWELTRGGHGETIVASEEMRYRGPGRVAVNTANVRRYELVPVSDLLGLLATVEADEPDFEPPTRRVVTAAKASR